MLPAQQGFGANHFAPAHIHLGLVCSTIHRLQRPADAIQAFVLPLMW